MNKIFTVLLTVFVVSWAVGCTRVDEPFTESGMPLTRSSSIDPEALRESAGIGSAENPYSLDNMQQALQQAVLSENRSALTLQATHEYVRFMPQDSVDVYILQDSLDLALFDYPLDRNLTDEEVEFYSNDTDENGFGWLYTVVPVGFSYPEEMEHQVIQEVYMQNEDMTRSGATGGGQMSMDEYDRVVDQSMRNVGVEIIGGGSAAGGAWTPSATIAYMDESSNRIPVERVRVYANTFVNIGYGETNAEGTATIAKGWGGKFRNPVRYHIEFESKWWRLKRNEWGRRAISDKTSRMDCRWEYTIMPENRRDFSYAVVNKALNYMFYEQDEFEKPYYHSKLNVAVFWNWADPKGKELGHCKMWALGMSVPNHIVIWGKSSSGYVSSLILQSTTFHELGHAAHLHLTPQKLQLYLNPSLNVFVESVAKMMEYYFMHRLHPDVPPWNYMGGYGETYTAIGISLLNQGITMQEMQQAIAMSDNVAQWVQAVKALGKVPDDLIDWIVKVKTQPLYWNVLTESILDDVNGYYLTGEPVVFQRNDTMKAVGARTQQWTTTAGDFDSKETDNMGVEFTFREPGTYKVSCQLSFPGEPETYPIEKEITVYATPPIVGSETAYVGIPQSYTLDLTDCIYNCSYSWFLGSFGYIESPYDEDQITMLSSEEDEVLEVMYYIPGEYVIRADLSMWMGLLPSHNERYSASSHTVAVHLEDYVSTNPPAFKTGIYPVKVHQKSDKTYQYYFYDGVFQHAGETLDDATYSFRAFNRMPTREHPYYDDLKPVYLHNMHQGVRFGDQVIQDNKDMVPSRSSTLAFCVFRTQKPHTVPLYTIQVTRVNSVASQTISYYLSKENVGNTSAKDGFVTVYYKNLGLLGYAYEY